MGAVYSCSGTNIVYLTYIINKDYGFPAGASTEEDSLITPSLVPIDTTENIYIIPPFVIKTTKPVFSSISYYSDSLNLYRVVPDIGVGTSEIITGPSVLTAGTGSIEVATVRVLSTDSNGNFAFGLEIVKGSGTDRDIVDSFGEAIGDSFGEGLQTTL
jgi:hypothetical protein